MRRGLWSGKRPPAIAGLGAFIALVFRQVAPEAKKPLARISERAYLSRRRHTQQPMILRSGEVCHARRYQPKYRCSRLPALVGGKLVFGLHSRLGAWGGDAHCHCGGPDPQPVLRQVAAHQPRESLALSKMMARKSHGQPPPPKRGALSLISLPDDPTLSNRTASDLGRR